MKRFLILALFGLTAISGTCRKDYCCAFPETPYITANLNNEKWYANPSEGYKHDDTTYVFAYGQGEQTLSFKFTGDKGNLTFQNATYFVTVGRDVIISEYFLDKAASNSFRITDYKENNKIAEGSFNLKFNNARNAASTDPAAITLSEGKFRLAFK